MNWNNGVLWHETGPRIEATASPMRNGDNGGPLRCLKINDLNPQIEMTWALTRSEMLQVGVWFLLRAFFPTKEPKL